MSWTPLSTKFLRDPRVRAAGRDAALLFVAGLGYCQEQETDGFIPEGMVAVLATEAWAKAKDAKALESSGLWRPVEGGWLVAGWLDWNRSRDEVEERREHERARKRQWREQKQKRDAGRDASRDRDATGESQGRDGSVRSTHTPTPVKPPQTPPEGGLDPRVHEAFGVAVAHLPYRKRTQAILALEAEKLTAVTRWIETWPGINVDQIAEGLKTGTLPRSVAYLDRADQPPSLEVVQ